MATSVHRIINGFLIMFTASEHLHGWLVYGGGAVLGLLCWWYLLIKLPVKPIRSLLFGAMVGALCMPWPTEDGGQFFAPAWLIAGSDGLFDGADAFWRAGTPLLMAIAGAAMVALIMQIAFSIKADSQQKASATVKRARERSDKQRAGASTV